MYIVNYGGAFKRRVGCTNRKEGSRGVYLGDYVLPQEGALSRRI